MGREWGRHEYWCIFFGAVVLIGGGVGGGWVCIWIKLSCLLK